MNNIPAFPAPAGVSHITEQGMTLRDYFAAKAMQGLASRLDNDQAYDGYAAWSYAMADAMLAAREF